ncbi:MAG: TonB family protein [Gammaproteobacteria bacterium]
MTTVLPSPVGPGDRLALTICFAVIVHAVVILGVTFKPPEVQASRFRSLDVILVHNRALEKVEDAEVLAQVSAAGGGDNEDNVRPATPFRAPFPEERADIAAAPPPGQVSALERSVQREPVRDLVKQTPLPAPRAAPEPVVSTVAQMEATSKPLPVEAAAPATDSAPAESAETSGASSSLVSRSLAMASLNAEIAQRLEARAKRPRRKYIAATTQEYKYAAYMEAWRAKVERIGNLNYPEKARRNRLTGSLILDVALKPNGSIAEISVRRPSGFRVLDEAAIRIVKLAAPYGRFPADIRRETDLLHITRTWQFLSNYRLASR